MLHPPGDNRHFSRPGGVRWLQTVVFFCTVLGPCWATMAANGQLELRVVDEDTGQPIAVTMQLRDSKGRSRKVRGVRSAGDRFVVDGTIVLKLPPGRYTFNIQRGMEYLDREGHFLIRSAASDSHTVSMKRFVDMRALGWHSIDVTHSAAGEMELLLRAMDLQRVAGDSAADEAWDQRYEIFGNRVSDRRVSDRRGVFAAGHQLALLHVDQPQRDGTAAAAPTATRLLKRARSQALAHCQAMDIAAVDFPMWVASGALDAVTVMAPWTTESNALTLPPDEIKFPGQRGAARWREYLYHRLLETGLRIAPTATSHVPARSVFRGQPRTYVRVSPRADEAANRDEVFWQALASGQTMLTSGPLMLAQVNGQPPGFVFDGFAGETVELKPTLTLHTKQRISYLEILKNGEVVHQVRLDDWVQAGGELPPVRFAKSGWMLVRAVVDNDDDYRFAMSAPSFVEFESRPRISTAATLFYLDWARRRLEETKGGDQARFHAAAVKFWESRRELANAP